MCRFEKHHKTQDLRTTGKKRLRHSERPNISWPFAHVSRHELSRHGQPHGVIFLTTDSRKRAKRRKFEWAAGSARHFLRLDLLPRRTHFCASLCALKPAGSGRTPRRTPFCASLFAPGSTGSCRGPRRTHFCAFTCKNVFAGFRHHFHLPASASVALKLFSLDKLVLFVHIVMQRLVPIPHLFGCPLTNHDRVHFCGLFAYSKCIQFQSPSLCTICMYMPNKLPRNTLYVQRAL